MMEKILIVFALIICCQGVLCQDSLISVPTGLAKEDDKYLLDNKVKGIALVNLGNSTLKHLPISLDNYLPYVMNQGNQGSCTAFAVAEALSIRENFINGRLRSNSSKNPQTLYSPTYLWVLENQKKPLDEPCSKNGISYSSAFSCLFTNKIVTWDTYPYPQNDQNLCHSSCPETVLNNKINDRIFAFDDVILDTSAFKDLLKQGYPVCIATNLDMGFYDALYDKELKGHWQKKKLPLTKEQHAMVVVDFDDEIRCFKVLDSHGSNLADNGIVWLSYDLVNHNLDEGVVFGCYRMSFEKVTDNGPKNIHYSTTSNSNAHIKITSSFSDPIVTGKIIDDNGIAIPGATISLKGTKSVTSADLDGNFKLKAPPNSTFVISSIGFQHQEARIGYDNYTEYANNACVTWTKEGYYRVFNGIRVGITDLNKKNKTVFLSIRDDYTGNILVNSVELKIGAETELIIGGTQFSIKLNKIAHAGSVLNITNWYAAFIEYKLISANETLKQFF
jgi:hypothetical protein